MRFATNCPDGCPPRDASPVNGDVLRFVKNNPPTAEDMRTYADLDKPAGDACGRCALSVLRRLEDVAVARKAMPWFKKRHVARATLSPAQGVIKQTGPQKFHHDYWVEVSFGPSIHEHFEVVAS